MSVKKRIVLSVTNDLFSDQRVDKIAHTLLAMGFEVKVIGRCYSNSLPLPKKSYQMERMRLLFKKGAIFYAEYNIRLFLRLLFVKCDVLYANDLDTLLPNVLVSNWRKKRLIYDSHEYFCGVAEIQDRPFVKKSWERIERFCFPKLTTIITVSQSIANLYEKQYGKKVLVVRNIPPLQVTTEELTRASLSLPEDKKIIILQGNAINQDRGGEEMVAALPFIPNAILLVVGAGCRVPAMKESAKALNIEERVVFAGRVPPSLLRGYTAIADVGVSFDKNVSINHKFSLPNKLFEYIHAAIPIVASDLPERRQIIEQYRVGKVVSSLEPKNIADAINQLLADTATYKQYRNNCITARAQLNWETEEKVFLQIPELR